MKPGQPYIEVSYCTTCMGRLHHLRQTLPRNLKANADLPVQFIVVDYNSRDGLGDWIQTRFPAEIEAGKLLYARTTEPRFFNMAHAKNVAHRLAAGRIVCSVDADNFVSGEFTRYLVSLFAKFPRIVARGMNIQSYWGRIALLNRWFQRLGGYDEKLGVRWGYEDSDFIARARGLGLREVALPEVFGESLPHSDIERLENFRGKFNHRNESHAVNERLSRRKLAKGHFVANGRSGWGRARLEINFAKPDRRNNKTSRRTGRALLSQGFGPKLLPAIRRRSPAPDRALQRAMAEVIRSVFDYQRVGFDHRPMTFLPSGAVGRGSARCETFWRLKRVRSRICLELMSESALTCPLARGKGGIWRGRWADFEKMPIRLAPIHRKRRLNADFAKFPQ